MKRHLKKQHVTKNHIHRHKHNMGEKIVGLPNETIKKLLSSEEEFEWFVNKTINEGPIAKQVRNALLLQGLDELVNVVSMLSEQAPTPFKGYEIESDSPEDVGYTYPVELSGDVLISFENKDDILYWLNEGPPHDVLKDILLLSTLNWVKNILKEQIKSGNHDE